MLRELEKKNTIQEAWLDHPGTTLDIVWKKEVKADVRTAELRSVANNRGISLDELIGKRRDASFKSFASGRGWYRGDEVDRLSEEEAAVIADRMICRAALKAPTIADKPASFKAAITNVIREQLPSCTSTQCKEDCRKKLVEIAHQSLNDQEFNALMEAQKQGPRPLDGEQ